MPKIGIDRMFDGKSRAFLFLTCSSPHGGEDSEPADVRSSVASLEQISTDRHT
jgi:hypothetical protein